MTADIELLTSSVAAFTEALKGERGSLDAWLEVNDEREVAAHVEAYARACVAHATAPLQAEIEALRAEVSAVKESLSTDLRAMRAERERAMEARQLISGDLATAEARAERLAEALRELVEYVQETAHHNAPAAAAARAALRDHDQEAGNG